MAKNGEENSKEHRILKNIDIISKFLKVSPDIQEKINIRQYVVLDKHELLMKLFLDFFLPKRLFPEVIEEDLAYLLAYNLMDSVGKENLINEWYYVRNLSPNKKNEPLIQFADGTVYRSVNELLEMNSVTFGEFLPILVKGAPLLRRFVLEQLTKREAISYIDDILSDWKSTLSKDDINVLTYIDAHPFANNEEIAQRFNTPVTDVSDTIDRLEKQIHFRLRGIPNYNKLGLQRILVEVPINVIIDFPYLTGYQELRSERAKFYSFTIPNQKGRKDPLIEFRTTMKKKTDCSIYQVTEIKQNLSFQYYDIDAHTWSIDWLVWSLWLERIVYFDRYHIVSPDVVKLKNNEDKPILFDLKDLEILENLLSNIRISSDELSKLINMSTADVGTRIKRLFDQGAFFPFIDLSFIGLDEHIIVFYKGEEEYLRPFEAALMELPAVLSYIVTPFRYSQKMLIAWLKLPSGSFIKFSNLINKTIRGLDSVWTAYRSHFMSRGKLLPIEMFNEETEEWLWDDNILDQLTILS